MISKNHFCNTCKDEKPKANVITWGTSSTFIFLSAVGRSDMDFGTLMKVILPTSMFEIYINSNAMKSL